MITCPQCNAQNLPGMAYCENCGSPLPQQEAGASAAPAPAPVIDATAAPTPDPVSVALPLPVMPADQPPSAPDLNLPSPADGANVVAAEPEQAAPDAAIPMPAAGAAAPSQGADQSQAAPPPPSPTPTPSQASPPTSAPAPAVAAPTPGVTPAGATLTITFPSGQVFTMQGDEANVGRADVAQSWHPEIDVIPYGGGAPDLGVSRHHARIERQDGAFSVVDVGSTNGTYINGHAAPYNQPVALNDGDTLSFGALNTQVSIK